MSLRSVGNQLLQTAPSLVLAGATKVSASFWVQVNSGSNVSGSSGLVIFGDTGGKFTAKLSGTGALQLQWSSNDGHSNGVSTCNLALTPGKSYHVASTWQPGAQQYYLNGMQVQADIQVGSLGVMGDAATHVFRVGSDRAGVDITLDQPTFWVGYALTSQDVVNLRNRSVQPGGISPASIALEWSLAGPAGVSSQVGDAGLADASTSGLALSSIVGAAPVYQVGDLTYVASPAIGQLVAASSGQSIVLIPQDGNGVNANITAMASSNEVQSIALTGTPAGNAFALSFGGHTTASIPVTLSPPNLYVLWTFPTVVGHSYNLDTAPPHTPSTSTYLYELIVGGSTVATQQIAGSDSTGTVDTGVVDGNGTLIPWIALFTGFTATSTSTEIRITCTTDGHLFACGIRVQDTTVPSIAYYAANQTANCTGANTFAFTYGYGYGGYVYGNTYGPGSGLGSTVTVTGDAPALQSSLQALSSIGFGGVTVTNPSSGTYSIAFSGPLANTAQPLITCADSAITITEISHGGTLPTLSINSGSPIPLVDWLWVTAGDNPAAFCVLPQSAPAVQTLLLSSPDYADTGTGWSGLSVTPLAGSAPGSNFAIYGAVAGQSGQFRVQILPPGTYQIAINYPNAPFTVNATNYTPATHTQFLVKDAFGNVLATYSVDQSAAPTDYTNSGVGWKILGSFTTDLYQNGLTVVMNTVGLTNTGNPTPVAILYAVQLMRTSADNSVIIGPTDSATVSFPAGWMTTSAGPLPATPNVPVSPPSKYSILPPFVANQKSLKPGYNVVPAAYFFNFLTHSNLTSLLGTRLGVTQDANGYPTRISKDQYGASGQLSLPIIINNAVSVLPPGVYTLEWDGSCAVRLQQIYGGTTVTTVSSNITGGAGNKILYNVQYDPAQGNGPTLRLYVTSNTVDSADVSGNTFLCDLQNLKIYPPDPADSTGATAWVNPSKFLPSFLYKLQGTQSIRFLDPLDANDNSIHSYTDYKPESFFDRTGGWKHTTIPIASIRDAPLNLIPPNYGSLAVQVTTTIPHGLYDLGLINMSGAGNITLNETPSWAPSGVVNLDAIVNYQSLVQVIDATNIIIYCQNDSRVTMNGVLTPSGATLSANWGSVWPLQDMVDLIVATNSPNMWFNVPISSDTSVGGCVDQTADFLAANLPAGVKVYVEFGNECWNIGFPTSFGSSIKNGFVTGNYVRYLYVPYYVRAAKAVHDRFLARFAAAGRPNDVVCVYGGLQGSGANAAQIAQEVTAIGGRMDSYCAAYYFSTGNTLHGDESTQRNIYNRMTANHCIDFMEFSSVHGRIDSYQQTMVPALAANGHASAQLTGYEGSPDCLVPGGSSVPNFAIRQAAVKRHPRMYGIMLHRLQVYQDNGLTLWNLYDLGGASNVHAWDAWESGDQQAGTGDPTQDPINVSNPLALNLVKSEIGGAWRYWSTLSQTTSIIINKKKLIPGRNGQVRAIGLPRGLQRPTR